MRKVFLTLSMLLVLGSATFVKADVMDLREPSFPGANADEGDPIVWDAPLAAALLAVSFYR